MNICVYGAASPNISKVYLEYMEILGRKLAERGHDLVFGAGCFGEMGAAARGFKAGGGKVFGIVPKYFTDDLIEPLFQNCDEFILTDDLNDRKSIMEERADAFVIAPGGVGTFDEFFQIMTLRQLQKLIKPIALFNISGYYNIVNELLEQAGRENFLHDNWRDLYRSFAENEMDELIAYLEAAPVTDMVKISDIGYGRQQ